jgi:hypothetical protein
MEQCLLTLDSLEEDHWSSFKHNEASKKLSKATFERHVNLRSFKDGDLVLTYDIDQDILSHGKFESL